VIFDINLYVYLLMYSLLASEGECKA